jgi:hypothetical protein
LNLILASLIYRYGNAETNSESEDSEEIEKKAPNDGELEIEDATDGVVKKLKKAGADDEKEKTQGDAKLMQAEDKETGNIGGRVYYLCKSSSSGPTSPSLNHHVLFIFRRLLFCY